MEEAGWPRMGLSHTRNEIFVGNIFTLLKLTISEIIFVFIYFLTGKEGQVQKRIVRPERNLMAFSQAQNVVLSYRKLDLGAVKNELTHTALAHFEETDTSLLVGETVALWECPCVPNSLNRATI